MTTTATKHERDEAYHVEIPFRPKKIHNRSSHFMVRKYSTVFERKLEAFSKFLQETNNNMID
jgi:hypothetical protein